MEERMKKALVAGLVLFGISFFFGYVVLAVGIGSVCPSLYKVAAPIVCGPNQKLEVVQNRHSWRPGATMWTATIYRIDTETNDKEDCTSRVKLAAGAVYGVGIFVLFFLLGLTKGARSAAKRASSPPTGEQAATPASSPAGTIDERLAKLKELHDSKLITAEEYEQKKTELLKQI